MILIALGSNLPSQAGGPKETLHAALAHLASNSVVPLKVSSFYKTQAWPDPNDPAFVNAVASIQTELSAELLMARLQETERAFGRERGVRNAPRSLDLDILDYDGRIAGGPPVLPHPRIENRAFVLIPLRDVAPSWRHPVSGRSVEDFIAALPERDRVTIAVAD